MSNKITFKKHPRETGIRAVDAGFWIDIKHNKKKIGMIHGLSWNKRTITIQIAFKDDSPNGWNWKFLKNTCDSEEQVREFIKGLTETILNSGVHYFNE